MVPIHYLNQCWHSQQDHRKSTQWIFLWNYKLFFLENMFEQCPFASESPFLSRKYVRTMPISLGKPFHVLFCGICKCEVSSFGLGMPEHLDYDFYDVICIFFVFELQSEIIAPNCAVWLLRQDLCQGWSDKQFMRYFISHKNVSCPFMENNVLIRSQLCTCHDS